MLTGKNLIGVASFITALTLLGAAINFTAQAVLAAQFGAGLDVDSYAYAISVPVFASAMVAIAMSYVLTPLLAKSVGESTEDPGPGQQVMAIIAPLAVFFALAGIAAVWLQPLLLPPPPAIREFNDLKTLILLAWLLGAVQILGSLATTCLTASGRPVVAALLAFPANIAAIAALILVSSQGIWVAIVGMFAGTLLSAGIGLWLAKAMLFPMARFWRLSWSKKIVAGNSILWSTIALSVFGTYQIVDAAFASQLGEGALASIGFAQRITIGFGSLIVAGPSALLVPRLARLVQAGETKAFRRLFYQALAFTGVGGLVLALSFFLFADTLVQILFERGKFSAADTEMLADVLRAMSPGLVAMIISVVTLRALFCLPGTARAAGLLAIAYTVSYAAFSGLLLGHGLSGIGTAYSLSWIGFAAASLIYVWFRSKLQIEIVVSTSPGKAL